MSAITVLVQRMKLAASLATQGEWSYTRSGFNSIVQASVTLLRGGPARVVLCKLFRSEWRSELNTAHDAAFIALANPTNVLALIDEIEAKNKHIDSLRKQRDEWECKAASNYAERTAMTNHIFELESRTNTVTLPSLKQTESGERYVWSDGVFNYKSDVIERLRAAGIRVIEGEA